MDILHPDTLASWPAYMQESERSSAAIKADFMAPFLISSPSYVPISFPPPIFTQSFLNEVAMVGLRLNELIVSLPDRMFAGVFDRMLEEQGISGEERAFLGSFLTPRLLAIAGAFCRPDLLVSIHGVKAIEANFSPALGGLGLADRVTDAFLRSGYCAYLQRSGLQFEAADMMAIWRRTVTAFLRRGRQVDRCLLFVALVDPVELQNPEVYFFDFLKAVEAQGFSVCFGLLQNLTVTPKGVFYEDARVDVIYAAYTYAETKRLHIPYGIVHELARADAYCLVDFIGSPANMLLDSKANLGLLTSERFLSSLDDSSRQFVRQYIPFTWTLTEASLAEALSLRDELVLKPTDDFGGSKVTVGQSVDSDAWARALHAALRDCSRYVLQRRVKSLWRWDGGGEPDGANYSVCLGPVILGSTYAGTVLRQAPNNGTAPIINVARGGAAGTALSAFRSPQYLGRERFEFAEHGQLKRNWSTETAGQEQ
jgi:hypothetical protein